MALDATVGGTAADTYGTIAEANVYFAGRQSAAWAVDDTAKELALRAAATYLDNAYRGRWKGQRAKELQARAWPRYDAVDADGYVISWTAIPANLKYAQFEAAKLIAAGTVLEATLPRAVKSERIGSIAVEYSDGAAQTARYPQITNYLSDLIIGGASVGGSIGSVALVRA